MSWTSSSPRAPEEFFSSFRHEGASKVSNSSLIIAIPPFGATKGLKLYSELLIVQWVLSVLTVQVCM